MIEQLFGSKTRVKLLYLFYGNPNRSFYVREITRKIDEQINSVRRELSNLLSIGIIKSDTSGNKLYYEVNQKYRHYDSLRAIFAQASTKKEPAAAAADDTAQKLQALGHVDFALLTGVFTRDKIAPVDVFIVGDVNRHKLDKLIAELEAEEGQELRFTVMNRDQYDYRRNLNDRFLTTVLDSKSTVLVDRVAEEEKLDKVVADKDKEKEKKAKRKKKES